MIFRSDSGLDLIALWHDCAAWAKQNPLKISGIGGFAAELLIMATGETIGSLLLFMAGFFGMTACLTLWIFGRGGHDHAAADAGILASPTGQNRALRLSKQCLMFWRYPAEAAAFQQGLCGLAFVAAGLQQQVAALIFTGLCCIGMATVVNCLPNRPGWRNPMVMGALMQGAATINVVLSAAEMHSWMMGLAALGYMINDVAFGLSLRHDNGRSF